MNLYRVKESIAEYYSHHKRSIIFFIYLVWACILGAILWAGWRSRDQLLPYISSANWARLPLVVVFYFLALILATANWAAIMHSFNRTLSWWTHVKIYLVTLVTRRLPGSVWYIGGRMMLYKKLGVSQIQTASASGVELIVSFAADCFLGGILLPLGFKLPLYWLIPLALVSLTSLIILNPSVLALAMQKFNRPLAHPIEGWRVAVWFLIRIALILAGGSMIFQTVRIFYPINSSLLLMVLGARALSGAAGMLTMFLPSSFGASDITLLSLLSTTIPTSLSTVITILVRMYTTLFEVVFGLIFYIILKNSPEFMNILLLEKERDTVSHT